MVFNITTCIFFVCLIVLIKFSSMPYLFSNSSWLITESDDIVKYGTLYDLSVGYFISYLMFLMIEIFPYKMSQVRARKIIEDPLGNIVISLGELVQVILSLYEIRISLNDIQEKDLLHISGNTNFSDEEFMFLTEYHIRKNDKRHYGIQKSTTLKKLINEVKKVVEENVDRVLDYSSIYGIENAELLLELHKVRDNNIFRYYGGTEMKVFLLHNVEKDLFNIIQSYNIISKLRLHNRYTKVEMLDEDPNVIKAENTADYHNELMKYIEVADKLNPVMITDAGRNALAITGQLLLGSGIQDYYLPDIKKDSNILVNTEYIIINMDNLSNILITIKLLKKTKKKVVILKSESILSNCYLIELVCKQYEVEKYDIWTYKSAHKILGNIYINFNRPNISDINTLINLIHNDLKAFKVS